MDFLRLIFSSFFRCWWAVITGFASIASWLFVSQEGILLTPLVFSLTNKLRSGSGVIEMNNFMPSASQTIILEVVSDVCTTALIFLCVHIFRKIIIPWYQTLIYRGANIGGEWYCSNTSLSQDIKIELTQNASNVKGLATLISIYRDDPDHEQIRIYRISGFIIDRFVQLTLQHADTKRIGVVNYLLEVVGDGRRMRGAATFYNIESCDIGAVKLAFTRDRIGQREGKGTVKTISANSNSCNKNIDNAIILC